MKGVSTMNLPTKGAHSPLIADKLAKFADEILLHCQKRLVFETRYFPWVCRTHPHPTVATVLLISFI